MALLVDIRITNSRGYTTRIESAEIRRLEPLHASRPELAADENHPYSVKLYDRYGNLKEEVILSGHRYGDGARELVRKALHALSVEDES